DWRRSAKVLVVCGDDGFLFGRATFELVWAGANRIPGVVLSVLLDGFDVDNRSVTIVGQQVGKRSVRCVQNELGGVVVDDLDFLEHLDAASEWRLGLRGRQAIE